MDQIANMLIAIKNAGLARKASTILPHSKMKMAILELLKTEGFIKTYNEVDVDGHKAIEVVIEYKDKITPRISGVERVSKLSRRVYKGTRDITQVKYGHGISVISTPKGILTNNQARKEMVGGEVLFTIW